MELIRAKKVSAAAAGAFELRDAVSRLPNPTEIPGATGLIQWPEVTLEIEALHERLESLGVVNRWTADERISLLHRTARLHTKLASAAVRIASVSGK